MKVPYVQGMVLGAVYCEQMVAQPATRRHYGDRDIIGLGRRYTDHKSALIEEDDGRIDIAAELAYRDAEIDRLHAALEKAVTEGAAAYRRGMRAGRDSYDASAPGRPLPEDDE